MGGRGSSSGAGGASTGLRNGWDPLKISKVSECQTKEEIQAYFDKKYNCQVNDIVFKEVEFNIAREGLQGVEDMLKKYPEIELTAVSSDTSESGIAYYNPSEHTIYFASAISKNVTEGETKGYLMAMWGFDTTKTSFHPKCKDFNDAVRQLFVHETAHALNANLDKKFAGYRTVTNKYAALIVHNAYKNLYKTNKSYEDVDGFIYFPAATPGSNGHFLRMCKKVSGYAASLTTTGRNPGVHQAWETWAEAFGDVYSNGKNAHPFSREIVRLAEIEYEGILKK